MHKPIKVLLVRFSSLGDVVLATAAVEALASSLAGSQIDFLTKEGFAPLFGDNPHIGEVLTLKDGEGIAAIAKRVSANGYDWIIDLHKTLRTGALKLLVRKPRWSVYRKDRLGRRIKALRHSRSESTAPHVIDRYLAALTPLGISPPRVLPKLYPTDAQKGGVEELLNAQGWNGATPLVALAPGARWKTKAWPVRNWIELATELKKEHSVTPILIGGSDEAELCRRIAERTGALNVAGSCSLMQSAALLRRATLLVANDSAPLHIATAVGTPVLALFGPTVEDFGFYPVGKDDRILGLDIDCRPCHVHGGKECPKGHHRCLEELAPGEVLRAATEMLNLGAN
jgi:heptosyltransferase-2